MVSLILQKLNISGHSVFQATSLKGDLKHMKRLNWNKLSDILSPNSFALRASPKDTL